MIMRTLSTALPLLTSAVLVLFSQKPLQADVITLSFEGYADGTKLSTQYLGLTFANATVITAGVSLNEFEFPPHSGSNVVFDDAGPVSIVFSTPVLSFSGYFTYLQRLTLAGFDASSSEVAYATSAFTSNLALSGDPGSSPNEFLSVSFAGGISGVTISADSGGASFVTDDLTYATPVPEPAGLSPLLTVSLLLALKRYRRGLSN